MSTINDGLIFGLDIGTRTIIGIVGHQERDKFIVHKSVCVSHEERAMLDGQVHNIEKVAFSVGIVKEMLEEAVGCELNEVAVAAAGRALNTQIVEVQKEYDEPRQLTKLDIEELEMYGVERAQNTLQAEEKFDIKEYICVGHSVVSYYLEDYLIMSLEGHKAKKAGVKLIATFLPKAVVEGLYAVANVVGLEIKLMTLEPIAAMHALIPPHLRLLNLVLVDVGAGTSDIAITKEGGVYNYGMIPIAGDEITEMLVHKYLIDFNTADRIKQEITFKEEVEFTDIMGIPNTASRTEIEEAISPIVEVLAGLIADKILELNSEPPNAVFCVGGGSQVLGLTDKISQKLDIMSQRVAVKQGVHVEGVIDEKREIEGPQMVTPYGICMIAGKSDKSNFITIHFKGAPVKLFYNKTLKVVDILTNLGIEHNKFFPTRGKSLFFKIDKKRQQVRGLQGNAGQILLNGKLSAIDALIKNNDKLEVVYATEGEDAKGKISEFIDNQKTIAINNKKIKLPLLFMNGNSISYDYWVQNNDEITTVNLVDVKSVNTYFGKENLINIVNNKEVDGNYILKDGDSITWKTQPVIKDVYKDKPSLNQKKPVQQKEKIEEKKIEEKIYEQIDEEQLLREYAIKELGIKADEIKLSIPKKNPSTTPSTTIASTPAMVKQGPSAQDKPKPIGNNSLNLIAVQVNGKIINIPAKKDLIFVNVFDYIDFNLQKPQGAIKLVLNGRQANYTDVLKNGDKIEIYWEK
ncbi:hypothetical protein AN639_10285 [Candidatus Epulonipiscium fishelsonii]|uniref:Uncharacterized protein n=1 Tax=Candidatus Epulonipiscium fishelsonii TaxID=77094 RepID=A0ACC8XC35_9FIRM|nr:hypothetical protein AN396_01015 [Epulopiscium sp. SCG-B11WGA-EpuloA1]ONI43568.1 hypothetical protein AN639_10285 [Epulopiscium sp. SCG-B05WGA-EpuloA1]